MALVMRRISSTSSCDKSPSAAPIAKTVNKMQSIIVSRQSIELTDHFVKIKPFFGLGFQDLEQNFPFPGAEIKTLRQGFLERFFSDGSKCSSTSATDASRVPSRQRKYSCPSSMEMSAPSFSILMRCGETSCSGNTEPFPVFLSCRFI